MKLTGKVKAFLEDLKKLTVGLRPDDVYCDKKPEKLDRDAKTVPENIDQLPFQETRITGYHLKHVA